jgi:CHAD domain-containing protein
MKETLEREIKLSPQEGFVLPELGGRRMPTRVFISTYHDTADLRLARHGITFRHRVEDGTGLWQLKLPRDAARLELELGGPPARPPAELVDLLPAFLRGEPLVPVARLRTRREVVLAQGAEIVDDSVAVLEGQRVSRRFREVEVELVDGDEKALRRLAKELRKAGAHETEEQQPKLYRALGLNGRPERPELTQDTPPGEALGLALEAEYRALLDHDPGTRRGDNPEDLHQLRVATRRLRAFLRAARPLVDREWAESLREELGWLGGHLGPARDLDVMLDRLRAEVQALGDDTGAAAGLLEGLAADRADAYRDVAETLRGDRYLALLDRLEAAAEPPLSGEEKTLTKIFHREAKRMRRTFADLGDNPEDDALHASRIAVKRARYAADLAAHELGKPGLGFVAVAKQLQDILGDHQDAVVAQERIREWAESATAPESGFAAGRLVQLERDRMAAARAAWPDTWRRLDEAARKAVS